MEILPLNKIISLYNKNYQKLYLEAIFHYSEGTLFSSILKVEENKVPSEI